MGLITTDRDLAARALTLVTELTAPPERVWELWATPGLFARWWGPPGVELVVDAHELTVGGRILFHVEVGDDRISGRLDVTAASRPTGLSFVFHGEGLQPIDIEVSIVPEGPALTRMAVVLRFPSEEAMHGALEIGVDGGVATAVARIDAALADGA